MRLQYWLPLSSLLAGSMACAAVLPLSLKIGDEVQPPGGVVQEKLFLTEPKPISTGKGKMAFAATVASGVDAVNLISTAGDAVGAAVVRGTSVKLVCIVPSSTLGQNIDAPLLTITGRVGSTVPLGTTTPLQISPQNLVFLDAQGNPYPEEINPGTLSIANNLSITDIIPGSGLVPAGGTLVIQGLNFNPDTEVKIKEAHVDNVAYISPTELHVTLRDAVVMQGRGVTVENKDNTSATYFSFQRTTRVGQTGSALLRATIPVFANLYWMNATFALAADSGTAYSGLAVQNLQGVAAGVKVSLVAMDGSIIGQRSFSLPPNTRRTNKVAELVSTPPPAGSSWRVQANMPVQMLGLSADDSTSTVIPVLPAAAQ